VLKSGKRLDLFTRRRVVHIESHSPARDPSNGRAPSVDREFCAVDKTGTICRQEDDSLGYFVAAARPGITILSILKVV